MITTTERGEKTFFLTLLVSTVLVLFSSVEMLPLLRCRKPMLSAGVRLGGHRAQGPGRHQGAAAAAIISPKPATTFSGRSQGRRRRRQESLEREKEQEAGELEEEETQKHGE